jgi:hypothetical protein
VAGSVVIQNLLAHHHGLLMEVEQQQMERRSARPGPCLHMQDRMSAKQRPNAIAFHGVPGCSCRLRASRPSSFNGSSFSTNLLEAQLVRLKRDGIYGSRIWRCSRQRFHVEL